MVVATCACSLLALDGVIRSNSTRLDSYYHSYFLRKVNAMNRNHPPRRVICMGSSRAAYAFVPGEFEHMTGEAAFNFGVPGTKVIEWQLSARRWVEPQEPALLILGVNGSEIRADYVPVPAARELFSLGDLVDYVLQDEWLTPVVGAYLEENPGSAWALYHRRFEILKFLQEHASPVLPKYAQLARERRMIATRICPPDGYEHPWEADRQLMTLAEMERRSPGNIMTAGIPEFSPDAPAVRRFRAFLKWLHARRIRVIVAYLPNSPRAEQRWGEVEVRLEATLADCCREANVPYVPASFQELPRTDADYFDETHMGTALARRLTRRIAERAIALGYLPAARDHVACALSESGRWPDERAGAESAAPSSASSVLSSGVQQQPGRRTDRP